MQNAAPDYAAVATFNRTTLELKYISIAFVFVQRVAFNRTTLELKYTFAFLNTEIQIF